MKIFSVVAVFTAATRVHTAANVLCERSETLRQDVDRLLASVRAA